MMDYVDDLLERIRALADGDAELSPEELRKLITDGVHYCELELANARRFEAEGLKIPPHLKETLEKMELVVHLGRTGAIIGIDPIPRLN